MCVVCYYHYLTCICIYRMFKTDLSLIDATKKCLRDEGWAFMARGMASNVTAVAIPIAITIFTTDILKALKHGDFKKKL